MILLSTQGTSRHSSPTCRTQAAHRAPLDRPLVSRHPGDAPLGRQIRIPVMTRLAEVRGRVAVLPGGAVVLAGDETHLDWLAPARDGPVAAVLLDDTSHTSALPHGGWPSVLALS